MTVAESEFYELDPDGDTILILKKPSVTQGETAAVAIAPSSKAKDESGSNNSINESGDVNPSSQSATQPFPDLPAEATTECSSPTTETVEDPVVCFKVSSRHLALASPVFRDLFQSGLTQNARDESSACMEVPLEWDDPSAFLILMRLVHGKFKQVPQTVNLATLSQIAILVDKYELIEMTEFVARGWIAGVEPDIPSELTEGLLSYLLIAGIFQNEELVKKASKVAVLKGEGVVEPNGLPIPVKILENINLRRERILREALNFLHGLWKSLLSQNLCKAGRECNALALGCLIMDMTSAKLHPLPEHPYAGFSVQKILRDLRKMQLPATCKYQNEAGVRWGGVEPLEGPFCKGVEHLLTDKIAGLQLQFETTLWDPDSRPYRKRARRLLRDPFSLPPVDKSWPWRPWRVIRVPQ